MMNEVEKEEWTTIQKVMGLINDKLDQFYEGGWLNGLRHGQGVFKYPNGTFLSYLLQIVYIKENGSKTKNTVTESKNSETDPFMMVSGLMIKNMAKELWFFLIKTDTLENGNLLL